MLRNNKIKTLYFFKERISFPIVVYVFNNWEEIQINYLSELIKDGRMTTLSISQWCNNHGLHYFVILPKNLLKLMLKEHL